MTHAAWQSDLELNGKKYYYTSLKAIEQAGLVTIASLPFSLRVLLESVARSVDGHTVTQDHVRQLAAGAAGVIPFRPARVLLQDFTGVPAVVDLASLRQAMADVGGDPADINPEVPVDLVIDHSLQVDAFGSAEALTINTDCEFERNMERYRLLHWAERAFANFRVLPPSAGIIHQLNLEYLAAVVLTKTEGESQWLFPDSVFGTDSHTTMINGLGVLGWGVGGIEAEAAMLGQVSYLPIPEVVGIRLHGQLPEQATATDLALKMTERLRKQNVVGKFVEFFGPGLAAMPLTDRAVVANMAPEYGATCAFFPVDRVVLRYLELTGRSQEQIERVEAYCQENHLFYRKSDAEPDFSAVLDVDLGAIEPAIAGPRRPQEWISLAEAPQSFRSVLAAEPEDGGFGADLDDDSSQEVAIDGSTTTRLGHGAVVLASITSCTNTSSPELLLCAGLMAKRAVELGVEVPPYVKTSFAPGSRVVTAYLEEANLLPYFEELGFHVVGYGCATCIGNSGPLIPEVAQAIQEQGLVAAAVLSGNRNFEGRIHPLVRANYLASPPLVLAYALAGTMHADLANEPLGEDEEGRGVFLRDLWPSAQEISELAQQVVSQKRFQEVYQDIGRVSPQWNAIEGEGNLLYPWEPHSTYIQNPPFFADKPTVTPAEALKKLRVVVKLGDSVTTDHISPAGAIHPDTPAGEYLQQQGVEPAEFNSYGSRRGNHEVMMRGTFANVRIRNQLAPGTEGGMTLHIPTGETVSIYEAAMRYKREGTGLVVIAGQDYGMGSSRDWAAKGPRLLGVEAVLAESFERIHRSNLVFMGILPLQFAPGENAETHGLTGKELLSIQLPQALEPGCQATVRAEEPSGKSKEFTVRVRFDSTAEVSYYHHGGILSQVLKEKQSGSRV